ncbi:hypothetical protein BT69DRAFT_1292281 [Atractiella rhizophila]|nr:hypothetical protein BT69DRAFT_1292281 [Atractiella rhizophila]
MSSHQSTSTPQVPPPVTDVASAVVAQLLPLISDLSRQIQQQSQQISGLEWKVDGQGEHVIQLQQLFQHQSRQITQLEQKVDRQGEVLMQEIRARTTGLENVNVGERLRVIEEAIQTSACHCLSAAEKMEQLEQLQREKVNRPSQRVPSPPNRFPPNSIPYKSFPNFLVEYFMCPTYFLCGPFALLERLYGHPAPVTLIPFGHRCLHAWTLLDSCFCLCVVYSRVVSAPLIRNRERKNAGQEQVNYVPLTWSPICGLVKVAFELRHCESFSLFRSSLETSNRQSEAKPVYRQPSDWPSGVEASGVRSRKEGRTFFGDDTACSPLLILPPTRLSSLGARLLLSVAQKLHPPHLQYRTGSPLEPTLVGSLFGEGVLRRALATFAGWGIRVRDAEEAEAEVTVAVALAEAFPILSAMSAHNDVYDLLYQVVQSRDENQLVGKTSVIEFPGIKTIAIAELE